MEGIHPHFTVTTLLSFLLLIQLQTSAEALCSPPDNPKIKENNKVNDVVANIPVDPGVTLTFKSPANPDNPFKLNGFQLLAATVLDAERESVYVVDITCKSSTGAETNLGFVVIVENENDNPPVFDKDNFTVNVNEMQPINTSVATFQARDLDGDALSYTLIDTSNSLKLRSPNSAEILLQKLLKYDDVKTIEVTLEARDTLFNSSTTINFTILDVDNRPPWFQPCTKYESGDNIVCPSSGYTGRVTLNEKEPGALPLNPGPLYAIDGDSGINEVITYSILSGDDGKLFEIDANTGNISMTKPADVLEPITLTVLAAQKISSYQIATTTVTINVLVKSLHSPQFEKPLYEGTVTGVGNLVMDLGDKDKPLQILATDADYNATGGLNPHINYNVNVGGFSLIGGYLFMTEPLPEATLNLQVLARDTSNDETATAQLVVEVKSGPKTTMVPPSTTDSTTDSKTTEDTVTPTTPSTSTDSSISTISTTPDVIVTSTNPSTSTDTSISTISTTNPSTSADSSSSVSTSVPSVTSESTISTTKSAMTTGGSVHTTNPSLTSEGSVSTASTAHPHTVIIPGVFGPRDMAALGATLGALLFISVVVIAVLILQIQKENKDWKKIYETNIFRSSLKNGAASLKNVLQYTNESFQRDEDGDLNGSGDPDKGDLVTGEEARKAERDFADYDTIMEPSELLQADDTSQTGSHNTDSEKEVMSILTKERRMDEGYKSVWFKEDIDPDAKEEVVIIPDSRENDSEEEEEEQASSDREEDEDDETQIKTPRVVFNDEQLISEHMVNPAQDSQDDESLIVDL